MVDLGCGVGRDVFILAKLVGENGRVIGVDSEKDQVSFEEGEMTIIDRRNLVGFRSTTCGLSYETIRIEWCECGIRSRRYRSIRSNKFASKFR